MSQLFHDIYPRVAMIVFHVDFSPGFDKRFDDSAVALLGSAVKRSESIHSLNVEEVVMKKLGHLRILEEMIEDSKSDSYLNSKERQHAKTLYRKV